MGTTNTCVTIAKDQIKVRESRNIVESCSGESDDAAGMQKRLD